MADYGGAGYNRLCDQVSLYMQCCCNISLPVEKGAIKLVVHFNSKLASFYLSVPSPWSVLSASATTSRSGTTRFSIPV